MSPSQSTHDDHPLSQEAPPHAGLSLQHLIAQHLNQDVSVPAAAPSEASSVAPKTVGFESAWQQSSQPALSQHAGQRLNAVDTTWAAGIEHLLPTPLFRLRVTKDRLVKERIALEHELMMAQQLQRIHPNVQQSNKPSNSLFKPTSNEQRITSLKERLHNLNRHEAHVDYQLRRLVGQQQGWLFVGVEGWQACQRYCLQWAAQLTQALSIHNHIRRWDPARQELSDTNVSLGHLEQMLSSDQRTEQGITPLNLAECITLYDRLSATADRLQNDLTQRPPLLQRLWASVTQSQSR